MGAAGMGDLSVLLVKKGSLRTFALFSSPSYVSRFVWVGQPAKNPGTHHVRIAIGFRNAWTRAVHV